MQKYNARVKVFLIESLKESVVFSEIQVTKNTDSSVCADENGAQTPACGPEVVLLTTLKRAGTPGQKTPVLCLHTLVPSMQYLLPRDSDLKSRKQVVFGSSDVTCALLAVGDPMGKFTCYR